MQDTTTYCLTQSDVEYLQIVHKMKKEGYHFSLIPKGDLMILYSKAKEKSEKDNS